jgi:hypothetical protein
MNKALHISHYVARPFLSSEHSLVAHARHSTPLTTL